MLAAQVLINALVLGCLYACIAIGFSLVWGVLNVINILHGTFIVLGYGVYPFRPPAAMPILLMFARAAALMPPTWMASSEPASSTRTAE